MNEDQTPDRFDLERWLQVLRRRWWLIALCAILVGGSALGFSLLQEKEYSARASLLFRDANLGQDIVGVGGGSSNVDPEREAATNVKLVQSPAVAVRTSRALGRRLSPSGVSNAIDVAAEGESDVVRIEATHTSRRFAARLANTYARQFIGFRREADRTKVRQVQASVQRQLDALPPDQRSSPAGRSLQTRVAQLDTLASLQTGNAELVQPASVPGSPSSPKTSLNVAAGTVLGLLLGFGLVLLLERLNRRVRESEELSDMYGLPVLAEVRNSEGIAEDDQDGHDGATEADREAFRMLRARLHYFHVDREIHSVLVTSCTPKEGKTTVAWHLAAATAASGGQRVLLLEADLRRPTMALTRGLQPTPGLSDTLVENLPFTEVVQEVSLAAEANGAEPGATMDVMVAGGIPPNPSELMESKRMVELLKSLTAMYDLVVLDTAPALLVADSIPLMKQVGGVLVVSRVGSTTRDAARTLRDQLRDLQAPVLGVVANGVKSPTEQPYGYGYGYGYPE